MTVLDLTSVSVDYKAHGSGFWRSGSSFRAVNDVSISIGEKETLALVGETGSGKSTLGKVATCLIRPSMGEVVFMGQRIDDLRDSQLRKIRAQVGMVFQDPHASLNPRHRLESSVGLPLASHTTKSRRSIRRDVHELLDRVGLTPADRFARSFPHQLSGGQRQRAAIARAIALRPRLIVADEPVSSLDVSMASQILNLLRELQDELGISYLLISHDLGVVRSFATRSAVMYRGRIVETGASAKVLTGAAHPYTQLLVSSIPEVISEIGEEAVSLSPTLTELSPLGGCAFQTRCSYAWEQCAQMPELLDVEESHSVRCHLVEISDPPTAWQMARSRLARS